jgi:phage terminase large subunit-like protein
VDRADARPATAECLSPAIKNQWVSSESTFVPIEWWDACVDPSTRPVVADQRLAVWLGLDASVKRDSTAIVACTFDHATKRVRLAWHRIFQPKRDDPLDFEATIEKTLLELRSRFDVREVRFDPYQLVAVAQRLTAAGLPMVEFPQSVPNLTEASSNLYELVKGRGLVAYQDPDFRLAVSRAVALETSRGWRIAKEKVSHKIDVVVALAQAALGAVQGQGIGLERILEYYRQGADNASPLSPSYPQPAVSYGAQFDKLWPTTGRRLHRSGPERARAAHDRSSMASPLSTC